MLSRVLSTITLSLLFFCSATAQTAADTWGTTQSLKVVGNHLENEDGQQVMLHGIMDTPSPYFCGYRFTNGQWINVFNDGDKYITNCINYFNQLFDATTHIKLRGKAPEGMQSWCNVFRLHLDPCWTDNPNLKYPGFRESGGKIYDPNGTEVSGEASIYHFDKARLKKYLSELYLKIAVKAERHGMHVIIRPPGVCPQNIKVGDYYQQYLIDVWDVVTTVAAENQEKFVNNNSGWISIELANEPIAILDKNGQNKNTGTTMRDFFQPVVDKIRANGFKGIIWIPGGTWQQEYKAYKTYPINDPLEVDNYGYAVHWYPGWYQTSDKQYNKENSLKAFLSSVPVAKTHPIMITEVDWSPEDPTGQGHYNESGQWVVPNCGTWATGTTSKFGEAYKYVIESLGNCGMTLTHTHDYLDIDYYLSQSIVRPAFYDKLSGDPWEACSGACFQWYDDFAHKVIKAHDWSDMYKFEDAQKVTVAPSALNDKRLIITDESRSNYYYVDQSLESPQNVHVASLNDWESTTYKYIKFQKVTSAGCATTGDLYTLRFFNESGSAYPLWGHTNGYLQAPPGVWCLFALGITNKSYGQDADYYGLWKVTYEDGKGYVIQNVGAAEAGESSYLSPSSATLVDTKTYVHLYTNAVENNSVGIQTPTVNDGELVVKAIYDINGRRLPAMQKGMNIIKYTNGAVRKVVK